MNIADNCVVSIHYTLTDDKGVTLDSSEGQEPLNYLHGANNIIPGLEKALVGKVAGDQLRVTIQPEDAYGELNPDLIQLVPASAFHVASLTMRVEPPLVSIWAALIMLPAPLPLVAATAITLVPVINCGLMLTSCEVCQPFATCEDATSVPLT